MSPSVRSTSRRAFVAAAATTAVALGAPTLARADTRTIRLLVGFPAGGGTDVLARLLAERLKDELGGATVIVDNKPGAGGQLAAQALKVAPADGTTYFLSHDHTISIIPLTVKAPGFDPAKDFVPVAGFASFANAVALAGAPAHGLREHLAAVKSGALKGAVGVPAPASVPEFLVKVLAERQGVDLVAVPYRGSAPMLQDLYGAQIPAAIGSVPELIEPHKAGRLKVVATMGTQRQAVLPDVPTLGELGIAGFEELPYYGVWAPAATAAAEVDRFGAALLRVVAQPAMRERLTALGMAVQPMSAAQLNARERAYTAAWSKIIKASGHQPQ